MQQLITSTYEHKLARVYHKIDRRGILTDHHKMAKLRVYCNDAINELCNSIGNAIGVKIYLGADNKPSNSVSVNINYSPNLQSLLKGLGYTLPKIRAKNKETHEYELKDSANKLVLQKVLADSTLWPSLPNLDSKKLIQDLLQIHTIAKIKSTYVNANLWNNIYYSSYGVAGTVTGRRSSRKHPFGFGGNGQNFPKYTELAGKFLEALIARPGYIFLFVDQVKAEEWPVSALAENHGALHELRNGINRHLNLASYLFSIPVDELKRRRKNGDLDAELCYYLAKKTRHANNYGMRPLRMSEQLAAEGHSISKDVCATMLEKVNNADPNVDKVFHEYIKSQIYATKMLRTPLGRERAFFGFRSGDKNYDLFNEAYSYIPQSTVGDNTGLAVLYLDDYNDCIIQEGHDSLGQEIKDDERRIFQVLTDTIKAFDREITFHNGISINIPIEAKIGYDFKHVVELKELSADGLSIAYKELQEQRAAEINEAVAGIL